MLHWLVHYLCNLGCIVKNAEAAGCHCSWILLAEHTAQRAEGKGQKGTDDDDGDVGEEWGPWACRHGHARTSHSIYGPVAAGDSDE